MNKSIPFALILALTAAPAVAQATSPTAVVASQGQMLHTADGGRLAAVQSVQADGSVQIIYFGKVVTIPAASLSSTADGELTTSLTKNQVIASR
jgi:hypothetical protein